MSPRIFILLILVPALTAALALPGCNQAPTGPAGGARPWSVRGITFADWSARGYTRPAALASMDQLADTGATDIVLVVTAYQPDTSSNLLNQNDPRTPLRSTVRSALIRARFTHGLDTALKPHVDVDSGAWRGLINPAEPELWFSEYRAFVLPWAELAEEVGAVRFVVGTELAGMLDHPEEWRRLIADVRKVFHGQLTYAASWDEAGLVPFWDDLDLVGVDFYAPVTVRNNAGRFDMLRGWQDWLGRLRSLHERTGLPVLFTEIGYRSVDGAGMHPYRFGDQAPIDFEEQADLYWAALQVVHDNEWLAGLYFWNWTTHAHAGADDTDFTPRGKPAEDVLRESWGDP